MKYTKLPPIDKGQVNQGCLCCPTPAIVANLEKVIAVGFGSAECTKNGELIYDGEDDYQHGKDPKTIGDMEAIAAADPENDWRVCFFGPLHGETYQRHGVNTWVMIESNMGFA
jgi:hypothetical protein